MLRTELSLSPHTKYKARRSPKNFKSHKSALQELNIKTFLTRRVKLLQKFAIKASRIMLFPFLRIRVIMLRWVNFVAYDEPYILNITPTVPIIIGKVPNFTHTRGVSGTPPPTHVLGKSFISNFSHHRLEIVKRDFLNYTSIEILCL